jgi:hypothetical protein
MNKKTAVGVVVYPLIVIVMCAKPTDRSFEWRQNVEVPVTNATFTLGEQFDRLFPGFGPENDSDAHYLSILNVNQRYNEALKELEPDTVKGDTVAFAIFNEDTTEFVADEDSLEDKVYHGVVGPITISNAPVVTDTFPLPPGQASNLPISIPLAVQLDKIYTVLFHPTSGPLSVTITNRSSGATLSDGVVSINGVGSAQFSPLGPGESSELSFPVAGNRVDSMISATVTGTLNSSGAVNAGDGLEIKFSVNGLIAHELTVVDSLVEFDQTFTNDYDITDTVNIHYVDVQYGFFQYSLTNGTGVDLSVTAVHRHLWMTPFCEPRGIVSVEDLAQHTSTQDSLAHSGLITSGPVSIPTDSVQQFEKLNLSGNRLFTEWQEDSQRTVTYVDYHVRNVQPTGKRISIASTDSLVFTISAVYVQLDKMYGTLMEDYERESDTEYVEIDFPWNEASKDSLRGKFLLQKVLANINIEMDLPERAFIDTFVMDFLIYDPDSQSVSCRDTATFLSVKRDTSYNEIIDITDIVNLYPDTVVIVVHGRVPRGTDLMVVNDLKIDSTGDLAHGKMGSMTIGAHAQYHLDAFLDWEVRDTLRMDLTNGDFEIWDWLKYIRRMHDREVAFFTDIENHTNVYMKLYALLAPNISKDSLDILDSTGVLSQEYVTQLLSEPGKALDNGYINLLGTDGLLIPPRGETVYDSVVLNEEQIKTFFTADSLCGMRWQLRFIPYDPPHPDALRDTDSIVVHSWLRIDGVQVLDSLLESE